MKLGQKLYTFILLFALGVGIVVYIQFSFAQETFRNQAGKEASRLAQIYLDFLESQISLRTEGIERLAHDRRVVAMAQQSNEYFDSLPDPESEIAEIESAWVSGRSHPHIDLILKNDLSKIFSRKIRFFLKKFEESLYGEILAANRHGVIFATHPKSSDFYQADEEWFRQSLNRPDVWMNEIGFDSSSNTFSLSVATRIKEDDQVLGVLKVGLKPNVLREILDHYKNISTFKSFQYYLVDRDGQGILTSLSNEETVGMLAEGAGFFGTPLATWTPVERLLKGQTGYMYLDEGGAQTLVAFAPSRDPQDSEGLGWGLVLEMDAGEVLAPSRYLEKRLQWIFALALTLFLILGGIFVVSITRPVRALTEGARKLESGDWDVNVATQSADEMGELSRAFQSMARELLKNNKELENRVRERTAEYQREQEKAEKANQAKSVFLSTMSHEIRTPLNAVLGYSQILARDIRLDPLQKKKIQAIYLSGKHLLALINDVLDLSKIEAGKLEIYTEDFDLAEMIREVVRMNVGVCEQKGLKLKVTGMNLGEKVGVRGDQAKIRQVLINLVGNAIKFTEQGEVELKVEQGEGNRFDFTVRDSGPGISAEYQKLIFEPFGQVDREKGKGGTGLGLAICKRLIDGMGGKLEVVSMEGEGSCFYYSLDLPPAEGPLPQKDDTLHAVTGLAAGFQVKALVVDDNETNTQILVEMLEALEVETQSVESGRKAMDRLRKWVPDIIFLDYSMPDMNGLQVVEQIHQRFGKDQIKIVMVSAYTFTHYRKMFEIGGSHAVLKKPVQREEILEVIQNLLGVEFQRA
ncbi:ATP-binding protein [Nitrospina sp. 32_T5]|uniref:hybrid sensor histidine kinase/response regulator n=1 Tax=unclassified Nitrospina TaxID=2638683 RepID=UPI003F9B671E